MSKAKQKLRVFFPGNYLACNNFEAAFERIKGQSMTLLYEAI